MAYTYTQFLAKHAAKFSKLTPAEKKKRYADYQRGTSAKANGTNRKIRVPRRRNAVKTTSLSTRTPDCLKALAALFSDPFNATVTGLPVFPAPPSQKLRIFSKGTFQSGTSGFGFVAIQPCLAQDYTNSIALSNNVGNPFAGNTVAVANPTNGVGFYGIAGNNPYSQTSFTSVTSGNNNNLEQRLVSAALRIRYTGTELNKSGTSVVFAEPEHMTTAGFGVGTVQQFEGCNLSPVSKSWQWACLTPVHRTELEYTNSPYLPTLSSANASSPNPTIWPLVAMVSGTVASSPFDYEVALTYEIIGTQVAEKSTNHVSSYAEAFISEVRGSTTNYAGGSGPSGSPPTQSSNVLGVLGSVLNSATPYILSAAKNALLVGLRS